MGYAFAMLHVEGKLNIDDPVSKYLDPWPEFDQVVTLRHLLTHTSGYREAYTMSNLAGRSVGVDRLSRDECLEVVRRQPELELIILADCQLKKLAHQSGNTESETPYTKTELK